MRRIIQSSAAIGFILGFAMIFGAYYIEGGSVTTLFLIPALMIVFGGTIATALIGNNWEHIARTPHLLKIVISPPQYDPVSIARQIIRYAIVARRHGILALEKFLSRTPHPYLRKLLQLVIDGTDPEELKKIAISELEYIARRHETNINIFGRMGGYAPTMGIIGTVMGLIATLASAGDDPTELIHHIAMAFIATMWGIVSANLIWLPIADKLKTLHEEEEQILKMMQEGMIALQQGAPPSTIKFIISSILPVSLQEQILNIPTYEILKEELPKSVPTGIEKTPKTP